MFELDELDVSFLYNNKKYLCNIYYIDSDNYAIRLYKDTIDKPELFSTYIDSDGGEVSGNAEIYTFENIDELIEKCYSIYNYYVNNNMLTKGEREEDL